MQWIQRALPASLAFMLVVHSASAVELDVQLDDITIVDSALPATTTYVPAFPIPGTGEIDFDLATGTIQISDYSTLIDFDFNPPGTDAQLDISNWSQAITAIDESGNITSTGSGDVGCTSFTGAGSFICDNLPDPPVVSWPPPDGPLFNSSAVIDTEAQTITIVDNSIALAGTLTSSYSYTIVVPLIADDYFTIVSGDQEVPPVATSSRSLSRFKFLPGDTALIGFRINVNHDQIVTDVHLHEGAMGVAGPVVLNMRPTIPGEGFCFDLFGGIVTYYVLTDGALRGSLAGKTLTDLKDLMTTGDTYINLHTSQNPSGWIRGQMIPEP